MSNQNFQLFEEDYQIINTTLARLLTESNARIVLLVDRSGQLISSHGDTSNLDSTAFASLSAGNFAATSALAKILGQDEFSVLFHQGEKESIHISVVQSRVILVVVFDNRTSLGLVRLRVKKSLEELSNVFENIFSKLGAVPQGTGLDDSFSSVAESEIDNLFRD